MLFVYASVILVILWAFTYATRGSDFEHVYNGRGTHRSYPILPSLGWRIAAGWFALLNGEATTSESKIAPIDDFFKLPALS